MGEAPDLLTAQECANLVGIDVETWSLHVVSDRAPQPYQQHGRVPVWDRDTVTSWHQTRRAQRARRRTRT